MKTFLGIIIGTTVIASLGACGDDPGDSRGSAESDSSLDDYLGFGHHTLEEELQFNDDEFSRENLIADCMEAEGFEYTPVPPGVVYYTDASGRQVEVGESSDAALRANDKYARSLPDDREVDYWRALANRDSGEQGISSSEMERLDPDGDGKISYEESLNNGCRGAATREIPGVFYILRVLGSADDELEDAIQRARAEAHDSLVECAHDILRESEVDDDEVVSYLEALAETDSPDAAAAQDCLAEFNAEVATRRGSLEREFFAQYQDRIQEHAVRYTPGP